LRLSSRNSISSPARATSYFTPVIAPRRACAIISAANIYEFTAVQLSMHFHLVTQMRPMSGNAQRHIIFQDVRQLSIEKNPTRSRPVVRARA
jgi:hypothetical protein